MHLPPISRAKHDEELEFVMEAATDQAALAVANLLASTRITQSELAQRVGVSRARISQILREDHTLNLTVRTMARIGYAMDHQIVIMFKRVRGLRWTR